MGTNNNGNQTITYDFKEEITSLGFNKLNYKLHPKGIYEGGELVKISNTEIEIQPMLCLFEDSSNSLVVRIESQDNATLTVSNINIFVIARFVWINTENNYMDILALPFVDVLETDLILGKLIYSGNILNTFDYSRKSYINSHYFNIYDNRPPLLVIPTYPYSNVVSVLPSNGELVHESKIINIESKTNSPSFTFPVSTYGRRDIVGINSNTNTIEILQGASSSGTPLPLVPSYILPIAIVTFPPSVISTVKGSYIQYINPIYFKSASISNTEIFDRIKTVSGIGDGLDGDYLDTKHASYYTDKLHELASTFNVTLPV